MKDRLPAPPADYTPDVIASVPERITPSGDQELVRYNRGVHLGRRGNGKFLDEYNQDVPDVGIVLSVAQSSVGFTGTSVGALPGYNVQVYNPNASSVESMWSDPIEEDEFVTIDHSYGNMDILPSSEWNTDKLGNQGLQYGVVRVVGTDGEMRHFLVGADFRGKPDNWNVEGRIDQMSEDEVTIMNRKLRARSLRSNLAAKALQQGSSGESIKDYVELDAAFISDYETVYRHDTTDVHVLSLERKAQQQLGRHFNNALGLLIVAAETNPNLFAGLEKEVDALGKRVTSIDRERSATKAGLLDQFQHAGDMRTRFLKAAQEYASRIQVTNKTGFSYANVARDAFDLVTSLAKNGPIMLPKDGELLQDITAAMDADAELTNRMVQSRAEAIQGTVLDKNVDESSVTREYATAGESVIISTDNDPVLTKEQIYQAFYVNSRTDAGKCTSKPEGFRALALAMIEHDGDQYFLLDNREGRGSELWTHDLMRSKSGSSTYRGERDRRGFMIIRATDNIDPMYGTEVLQQSIIERSRFNDRPNYVHTRKFGGRGQYESPDESAGGLYVDITEDGTISAYASDGPVRITTAKNDSAK